ncbi:MAG TPA: hypothetical protein VGQ14_04090 [Candidatus Eisenbacteria bacterium]|nr:hypothetical protein [Candidatus Eisenbacteria bacterium]
MKLSSFHATRLAARAAGTAILGAAIAAAPGPARADSVSLSWTASGDDGTIGRASVYELRYSTTPVGADTISWWGNSTSAGVIPAPQTAGSHETYTMNGLTSGQTFYFILRVGDEVPNWSGFSNVMSKSTGSASTLATPGSFAARAVGGGVQLIWTEPGSNAGEGYHIYRSSGSVVDSLLATIPIGPESYTDPDVTVGTSYTYKIACYMGTSEGSMATTSINVAAQTIVTTEAIHGYPNPASDKVTLRFVGGTTDGQPAHIKLSIYDLSGHLVAKVLDQVMPAGAQTYDWLCQSDKGNRVAPGLYNAIFESPRGREITRIAIVP